MQIPAFARNSVKNFTPPSLLHTRLSLRNPAHLRADAHPMAAKLERRKLHPIHQRRISTKTNTMEQIFDKNDISENEENVFGRGLRAWKCILVGR